MSKKILIASLALFIHFICLAQPNPETRMLDYDPDKLKIIPDKVFEIGLPFLFMFLLLNTIVIVLKNRADQQLKLKMIEKGVSEETLVKIFKESNAIARLQPLKWFLFSLAAGISLLTIHFSRNYLVNQSGYLAIGIFLLFMSAAFFIYYTILSRKA